MELNFFLQTLRYTGFIKNPKEKVTKFQILWLFICIILGTLSFLNPINFYLSTNKTMAKGIESAFVFLSLILTLFRRGYIYLNTQKIHDLLEQLDVTLEDEESQEFKDWRREAQLSSHKRLNRVKNAFLLYNVPSYTVESCAFLIELWRQLQGPRGKRHLYIAVWWPTDSQEETSYIFISLATLSGILMNLITMFAADTFTCALMFVVSERASFLANSAPKALLPGPDGEVSEDFKTWVKYHQHYNKIMDATNNLLGPILFVVNLSSTLYLVALIYLPFGNKVTIVNQSGQNVAVIGIMIQVFIFCYFGQKVIDKSILLRNSVVGSSQVSQGALQSSPACSALQVVVTRVAGGAPPEEINAMGYFPITMELFSTFLSGVVSYLLILYQWKS